MMEEVNDDTNGESTFEFVGDKTDDNLVKSDPVSSTTSVSSAELLTGASPTAVALSSPLLSSGSSYMQPSMSSGVFVPSAVTTVQPTVTPVQFTSAAPATASAIPMYNPNQQFGPSVMPYIPPPISPTQLYQPSAVVENKPSPNIYAIPGASSQEYISSPTSPSSTNANSFQSVPQSALELPLDDDLVSSSGQPFPESGEKGVWGWLKGNEFLNKVATKAKNSMDSVITTLDPGMKEIIYSGGDINIIVASGNEPKISIVREAFQQVFGKATIDGIAVQSSSIAPQPVGFSAGLKAAEERISNLRQQGLIHEHQVIVAIENFLAEITPNKWYDLGCIILQDPAARIDIQVYTEAVPVPAHFVAQAKEQTPPGYPLGWSGYAVTIGQIMGTALGVHHSEWHQALTGVSRREIMFLAAKTLAGMYKAQLRR